MFLRPVFENVYLSTGDLHDTSCQNFSARTVVSFLLFNFLKRVFRYIFMNTDVKLTLCQ